MRNNKNVHINVLEKELDIPTKEIVKLRNKVGIKHKKIVFTINEANKIRNEVFKETNIMKKKEIKKMSSKDLNIIYYGPAGTGKTREALKKVEELTFENHNKPLLEKELQDLEEKFEEAKGRSATALGNKIKKLKEDILALDEEKKTFYEFTTFHPSYQYQEFINTIAKNLTQYYHES